MYLVLTFKGRRALLFCIVTWLSSRKYRQDGYCYKWLLSLYLGQIKLYRRLSLALLIKAISKTTLN